MTSSFGIIRKIRWTAKICPLVIHIACDVGNRGRHNGKTKVKPSRLLLTYKQNRAHPRHYRSEYVRGYLHRKRCVQPSRLVVATIPH